MDAETKLHKAVRGQLAVPFGHQRLHLDRRLDGADDARKLQHEAIAGVFHQSATVVENDRVHRASMGLERGMGARLVGAHQPRVASDISADYGGSRAPSGTTLSGRPTESNDFKTPRSRRKPDLDEEVIQSVNNAANGPDRS